MFNGGFGTMPMGGLFGPNYGHQNVNFNFRNGQVPMQNNFDPTGINPAMSIGSQTAETPLLECKNEGELLISGGSIGISKTDYQVVYGESPISSDLIAEYIAENGDNNTICIGEQNEKIYFVHANKAYDGDSDTIEEQLFHGQTVASLWVREKNAPILTVLDPDGLEDKKMMDRYLYRTIYTARQKNYDHFFLVIEESGSLEEGEPETCSLQLNRGLFRKTIYKIDIVAEPTNWVVDRQGENFQEVSPNGLNMNHA